MPDADPVPTPAPAPSPVPAPVPAPYQAAIPLPAPAPAPAPAHNDSVANLRAELAAERVSKRDVETRLATMQADLERVRGEAEQRARTAVDAVNGKLTKMQQRVVEAELRAQANEFGLRDPDLLLHPLLDRGTIKLDDDGNVTGVKEAFESLKGKKPDWFKAADPTPTPTPAPAPRTTGAPVPAPSGNTPTADVRKLTPADYKAHRENFLRNLRQHA